MSAPARDTRGRIEAAALKLFAERGVDGASMRDIAGAVSLTEGALYRHFPSKDALARALFLDRYGALARGIETIRAKNLPFAGRIEALVGFFAERFDDDPAGFAYVLVAQHDHLRDLPRDAPENMVEALSRLFADAMAAGEIPPGDPALATAIALGVMVQPAVFHIYGRLESPPSAQRAQLTTSIVRALNTDK